MLFTDFFFCFSKLLLYFRPAFLNPNYSAPRFYHNLGRRRKAILHGNLSGQFYLPPSNKKSLKVFKNVYFWVDIIYFFTKYPINWPLRFILYFLEKVPRPVFVKHCFRQSTVEIQYTPIFKVILQHYNLMLINIYVKHELWTIVSKRPFLYWPWSKNWIKSNLIFIWHFFIEIKKKKSLEKDGKQ